VSIFRSIYRGLVPEDVRNYVTDVRRYRRKRYHEDDAFSLREFERRNCLFIHIPKTGGISIANALFGGRSGGHLTLHGYERIYGRRRVRRFFKFAFVRNPWDRLVSAYFFLKKGGMNDDDRRWAEQNLSAFDSFPEFVERWVNEESVRSWVHFRPQCDILCGRDDSLGVDFIGRYEQLEQDFERLRERLGFGDPLPHLNRTQRAPYSSVYDNRTRELVARAYARDIELFDYSFEDGSASALRCEAATSR
jgi:hypothetical protein